MPKPKQTHTLVQNKASIEQQKAQQRAAHAAAGILSAGIEMMPGIPAAERQCYVDFIRAMFRLANGTTLTEAEQYAWATVPPTPGEVLQ